MKSSSRLVSIAACLSVLVALAPSPSAQQENAAARVAAIKEWIAQSKAHLKNYQWIETTVVSLKGEVKTTKVANCYYDVTGTLQKVQTSETAPKPKPGIRGAIAKDKTKDMTEYMDKAVALVKSYMPPSGEKIQASKDAGKMSVDFLPGGQNVRLNFHDYQLPGDNLSVSLDPATNRPLGFGVNTYIDDAKDAVILAVTVGTLPDGTGYADKITLDAKAKEITVTVTNSGYRKAN